MATQIELDKNVKDVNITNPQEGDVLTYDLSEDEWINQPPTVAYGGIYGHNVDVDIVLTTIDFAYRISFYCRWSK